MKLTIDQRVALLAKFGGRCAYCGCELNGKWHADHMEPVERQLRFERDKRGMTRMVATGKLYRPENDHLGNMMPACVPCNVDKASMPIERWRAYLGERIHEGLRRNSSAFRHAERFGMITIKPGPIVFWFEEYAALADVS